MQLSKKPKTFSQIFLAFFKSTWILQHFEKKRWASKLKYFWSYWHRSMWFPESSKAPASKNPFEGSELTVRKHWNVSRRCFDVNFSLMPDKSRMERSLINRSEILGRCFNKLMGEQMYSRLNRDFPATSSNVIFEKKPKTFSPTFITFFRCT